MRYNDEKRYVGHRDQLLKAKRIVLQDGKANNVSMIDVSNRSGMRFDVNISRGMDIPYLEYSVPIGTDFLSLLKRLTIRNILTIRNLAF